MPYTQLLYHIVFGTQNRQGTLIGNDYQQLCKYIAGIIKHKNCIPHIIDGYNDHIHIFCNIHPTISISDFVKDIKLASSKWIKESKLFPNFQGWQDGYGAFTCSYSVKQDVIKYISCQYDHHRHKSFRQEYIEFLQKAGIEYDEKYI